MHKMFLTCMLQFLNFWTSFLSEKKLSNDFYRAMHFSAKRGIAISHVVCLSVRLSVCVVGEL